LLGIALGYGIAVQRIRMAVWNPALDQGGLDEAVPNRPSHEPAPKSSSISIFWKPPTLKFPSCGSTCDSPSRNKILLIPILSMILIQPQTRLFQPSLLCIWSREGSLASQDTIRMDSP